MIVFFIIVGVAAAVAALYIIEQKAMPDDTSNVPPPSEDVSTPVQSSEEGAPGGTIPTPDQTMSLRSIGLKALATGIARAEGYFVKGALPQRSNNPGDLTKSFGHAVSGIANKEGVLIFATADDGWAALYDQLNLIYSGQSVVYSVDMSIAAFAAKWTGAPDNQGWIAAVLQELNKTGSYTAQSSLNDVVGASV